MVFLCRLVSDANATSTSYWLKNVLRCSIVTSCGSIFAVAAQLRKEYHMASGNYEIREKEAANEDLDARRG